MSDRPMIYASLVAVMRDVQAVAKKDRNNHQNFNFRGIDAVVNAVGPALRTHGVVVVPQVTSVVYDDVQTSTGKPATACRVKVAYLFFAEDGSHVETSVAGEAWDAGDKACPKAMSVAFRTALLQALSLPTDEPDPDSTTFERAATVDVKAGLADELSALNGLIVKAREAGVTGDFDATRAWAAESTPNAKAAVSKLRKALAEAGGGA